MIPYGRQYIDKADIQAVVNVLKSDFVTQGPKIPEFEQKLAEYCGCRYAIVFNSGTSALHGAYFTLGLGKSDEFITSPITFVATANAGLYLGAKPVFVDVEPDTGNIDAARIEQKITRKTKLIVPVHYAGHPADMQKIRRIAKKHNLAVVEDACHALGAEFKGQKIGSCRHSDMAVLSFHPVKHITTGEGGAVLTNRKEYYEKLLMFRSHGITKNAKQFRSLNKSHSLSSAHSLNMSHSFDKSRSLSSSDSLIPPVPDWYYEMQYLGYNYRMTDIQAALGISQLKKLDVFVEKRRKIAESYQKAFRDNPYFDIPPERHYATSSYHLYPIRLKDGYKEKKAEIFVWLRGKGIGVQVHYIPVYLQPYYQDMGYRQGVCPVAEDFYQREISIPMYPDMNAQDIRYVKEGIFRVFGDIR